ILVFRKLRSSASHPGTSCPAPSNCARTRRHRLKRIRLRSRYSRSEPDSQTARSAVHRHDRRHAQLHESTCGALLHLPQVDSHGPRRRPVWHRHPELFPGRSAAGIRRPASGSQSKRLYPELEHRQGPTVADEALVATPDLRRLGMGDRRRPLVGSEHPGGAMGSC
ncbi:MAG: hypothetical protein QOJ56_4663, partial [Mycobacterium sp.]|nr:hypothetical protein [Mycobacterium sp.]